MSVQDDGMMSCCGKYSCGTVMTMDPSALSVDILLSLCDSSPATAAGLSLRFPIDFEAYDVMHVLLTEELTTMMWFLRSRTHALSCFILMHRCGKHTGTAVTSV